MDHASRAIVCAVMALLMGCGCDSTGPELTWAKVAGTYAGEVSGGSAYGQLAGTLTLTLTQDGEKLAGSYVMTGNVTAPISPGPVSVTGPVVGYLEFKGESPILTLSFYEPNCGTHGYASYGGYHSPAREVRLNYATFLVCGVSNREFTVGAVSLVRH